MIDARIILAFIALLVLSALSDFMKFFGIDFFTALQVIGCLILLWLGAYFVVGYLKQDLMLVAPILAVGLYACFIPAYDFWSATEIKALGLYGYPVKQVMWYADGVYQFGIALAILLGGYGLIYFVDKSEG